MENKMPKLWNFKCRWLWNIFYRLHAFIRQHKCQNINSDKTTQHKKVGDHNDHRL